MKKFNTNSNAYIIVYSTVMVVAVATLLAVAALSLQKRQYANELNDPVLSLGAALWGGLITICLSGPIACE